MPRNQPDTVRVYPSASLDPTEYVPGVGEDGAELPREEAERMRDAGIVRYSRGPDPHPEPVVVSQPDGTAEPEKE